MDAPTVASKPCCVCGAKKGKHCAKCKSRHYCSKACQLVDWKEGGHNKACKQLTAAFQDRLLDELMPEKKPKEEPSIVEGVSPVAGSKARLSAVRATAEASAPNDDTLDWRGTCAICLDLLPIEAERQIFISCCCKKICKDCSDKCDEYDTRCPLCRAPAANPAAEALRRLQKHVDKGNAAVQVQLGDAYRKGDMGLKKRDAERREAGVPALRARCSARTCGSPVFNGFLLSVWTRRQDQPQDRRAVVPTRSRARLSCCAVQLRFFYFGQGRFYFGQGAAQSYDEAVKWYRLAAAQGQADVAFMISECHAHGLGVPQDLDEALRLCKRAAAKGRAGAAEQADELEAFLAPPRRA